MRIGFIGLGQMGRGMAGRLLDTGHELAVWNRTRAAAEPFRARGARVAGRIEELFEAEVVITMLAHDAAVEAVWVAPGAIAKLPAQTVHLNMASVSLALGKRLAELHTAAGTQYVSAPVFGRPEPAASGQLDIIAAGPAAAVEHCTPLFEALGRRWFNVGTDAHCANIVKIARNFLLGSIIESLGEAFALAQKSGVAPSTFLDIITSTSLNCPAYRNYGRMIIEKSAPTFSLKLGMKDVAVALQAAEETGVPMPLAEMLLREHAAAIDAGYGERDWASLGNYIAARAGLD